MPQFATVWSSLSAQRRVIVVLATAAMFIAVMVLSRMATTPSLSLLYSGLESQAAGDVLAALDQRGVVYEVRGGTIYVESAQRDALRMALAAEGLPANGTAGYELLDSLSGFGTTAQMFDATYWRAKEGELARTIAASPMVRSARVHIASATNTGFRRDLAPSASVTLVPAGQLVSPQQARAVRFLVASAVAGLSPDAVSVIDAESGRVLEGEGEGASAQGEADRSEQLRHNVERLLEARVGAGHAMVEVSVETRTEREEITERLLNPDSRVAISTDTEERSTESADAQDGAVTVASNLPEGDAAGAGGASTSRNSETRERVNYEISETQRAVLRIPGGVRRITVAVLVDGVRGTDAAGNAVWEPRPDDELAALRELVASVVGYDEARGDVITLKSMPFEPLAGPGTEAGAGLLAGLDLMSAIQLAVLAAVALVLGLFVVRPILLPAAASGQARLPAGGAVRALGGPAGNFSQPADETEIGAGGEVFTGEIEDEPFEGGFPTVNADLPSLGDLVGAGEADFDTNDPVARLRRLITERQDETVEILRNWMDETEGRA